MFLLQAPKATDFDVTMVPWYLIMALMVFEVGQQYLLEDDSPGDGAALPLAVSSQRESRS